MAAVQIPRPAAAAPCRACCPRTSGSPPSPRLAASTASIDIATRDLESRLSGRDDAARRSRSLQSHQGDGRDGFVLNPNYPRDSAELPLIAEHSVDAAVSNW